MRLTIEQIDRLRDEGYLVVPEAVDPKRVAVARALVLQWIGSFVPGIFSGSPAGVSASLEDLLSDDRLATLLDASWECVDQLFGVGSASKPTAASQVTSWFPTLAPASWPPAMHEGMDFHVDAPRPFVQAGVLTTDGFERRMELARGLGPHIPMPDFLGNIGVALTPIQRDNTGNLAVLSGSHQLLADFFARTGTSFADYGYAPPPSEAGISYQSEQTLRQIRMDPGDLVILNSQLVHAVIPNRGSHLRLSVYFRLGNDARSQLSQPHLEPWVMWPGVVKRAV